MALEAIYPLIASYSLIMMPVRKALKGDWDPKALLGALGTAGICTCVAKITNDPTALAIILYLVFMATAKHQEWLEKTKEFQEKEEPSEPYDPVTPLTFANFEWDRLLEVHRLLSRYKLVTLLQEIESPAKSQ